jgi:HlyD family secretion protein
MRRRWAMKIAVWTLGVSVAGCTRASEPDAYGNVEATEVVVSSEVGGQLTSFGVEEGQTLALGDRAGIVDATQLTLQRGEAEAQREAAVSRAGEVDRQTQVLAAQRDALHAQKNGAAAQRSALASQVEIARRQYERMQRLSTQQAATAQQLDQAEREYRVLQDQIKAADEQIEGLARQVAAQTAQIGVAEQQHRTARTQIAVSDAQIARLADRVQKSTIVNPRAGTVLVTYAKQGEIVQPGQPLYKIADLATVDVRAYVIEPQLASVRVGQPVRVSVDVADKQRQTLSGTVSWVASQAEFTPTPIQTRDERADFVYAVKIRVPNQNGMLKIGMPVDVEFAQ